MPETKTRRLDVIYREGKPAAVILDIDEYEELIEQLENSQDLAYIRELKKKELEFELLEDILRERSADV